MPSHLSADRPAAQPPGRGSVEALISQARRLRGEVDAVRRDSQDDDTDPRGRWQRALCDLALHHLRDLDDHLARLRDGPEPLPRPSSLLSRVGSAEWNLLTDEADWSSELYLILGRDPAEAPLSLDALPSLVLPEDRPRLTAMVTDCLVDARSIDGEFRIVRPDGAVRTVHMMGEPVLDADGGTASMWAVLRDVSELRLTERAVSETHASLRFPPPPAPGAPDPQPPPWQGMLPFPEEGRPGLDLAAAHLPGPAGATAGTAWYDACALPGDDTLLGIGCLAAGAGPARSPALVIGALRGMALAGVGPEELADRLALLLGAPATPAPGTTLCCGYRPGTRTLVWAHTGHPAPLLFRGGTGRVLDGRTTATLHAGDLLLLHGGGPVAEHPGHASAALAHRLLALAPRLSGARTAREGVRMVTEEFGGKDDSGRGDGTGGAVDACVLAARVTA
ncbi:PAS domain-containing protein [Streptomyces tagetis]|uniref:histidine kinase n=1 Tax=Streptomyces tagetis TaxID=2820809 RepID=A0A940XHZ3_9ACTN|nr:PAS domain-containing protein [Streptomyces sp. RG38]MBQ0826896.1 PAS domain-containing protein [Streptomyces sp. RG38]